MKNFESRLEDLNSFDSQFVKESKNLIKKSNLDSNLLESMLKAIKIYTGTTKKLDYYSAILFCILDQNTKNTKLETETTLANIISKLLELKAHKHAYAIILYLHHSLTNINSSIQNSFSKTTPTIDTFKTLVTIKTNIKYTKTFIQLVCVLLLNTIRLFIALGFKINNVS